MYPTLLAQSSIGGQLTEVLGDVVAFVPKLLAFLAILLIGWFVAKALAKATNAVLERVGFDNAVERGGVKQALARSRYDASDILAKIVLYAIMLFVLQLAFGVFGPNPISDLIQGVIAFLPKLFVAVIIVVIASAVAAGVREVISASLGGLSYGNALATTAGVLILGVGIFAALNQIEIAPAIVNGLFYALLAIVAGSAIVAIGGSGIVPLRAYWEQALDRASEESTKIRDEAQGSREDIKQRAQQRKQQASSDDGDGSGRRTAGSTAADDGAADRADRDARVADERRR